MIRHIRVRVLLLRLLVRVQVRVVLVLEHGLDVSPHQSQEQRDTETGRDQVEEGGLGVFVDVHHEDGEEEAGQVGCRTTSVLTLSPTLLSTQYSPINVA